MQTSTSGLASVSFCRIMAILSLILAAPGGCCGCLKSRGMNGLCVMPMIETIWAMGYLLKLIMVVSNTADLRVAMIIATPSCYSEETQATKNLVLDPRSFTSFKMTLTPGTMWQRANSRSAWIID